MASKLPATCHPDNRVLFEAIRKVVNEANDSPLGFISRYAPPNEPTVGNHLLFQIAGLPVDSDLADREPTVPPVPTLLSDGNHSIVALNSQGSFQPSGVKCNGELRTISLGEDPKGVGIPSFPLISVSVGALAALGNAAGGYPEYLGWPLIKDNVMSQICDYYVDEDENVAILVRPAELIYQLRCILGSRLSDESDAFRASALADAKKIMTGCLAILLSFELDSEDALKHADERTFRELSAKQALSVRRMNFNSAQCQTFRKHLFTDDCPEDEQVVRLLGSIIKDWVYVVFLAARECAKALGGENVEPLELNW